MYKETQKNSYSMKTNWQALRLFHSLNPKYYPLLIHAKFFLVFSPFFNLYMSAEIISELAGSRDSHTLFLLVLIILVGDLLISLMKAYLQRIVKHNKELLDQKEMILFNQKMMEMDYSDLEQPEVSSLRLKIEEASNIAHGKYLLMEKTEQSIEQILSLLLGVYLMVEMVTVIFRNGFSFLTLGFLILLLAFIILNVRISSANAKKVSEKWDKISEAMMEYLRVNHKLPDESAGKDVRFYRQDKLVKELQIVQIEKQTKAFADAYGTKFRLSIPNYAISNGVSILVYLFICLYALKGIFGVGSIIKYVSFLQNVLNSFTTLSEDFHEIKYNTPFMEEYLRYLAIKQHMTSGSLPVEKRILCENGDNDYEIEFKDVSFRYPGSENYTLQNISLKFRIGERMAVVGRNGSGKTTFIKLLCRLYDPTEGQILLNGIDIRKYNYDEYLSIFSVVFQDFKLFSFSVAQNIATSLEYDKSEIEQCLVKVGFGERLKDMSQGIDTCLYKNFEKQGVEISGGEAQKLAMARALYKNAPIIILDEPTAALDPISEYEIYSRFNELIGQRTAVYISHRLSSCRFCDDIIVFEQGQIVQRGCHDQLVTDITGKYYELWQAQAQYYTAQAV